MDDKQIARIVDAVFNELTQRKGFDDWFDMIEADEIRKEIKRDCRDAVRKVVAPIWWNYTKQKTGVIA